MGSVRFAGGGAAAPKTWADVAGILTTRSTLAQRRDALAAFGKDPLLRTLLPPVRKAAGDLRPVAIEPARAFVRCAAEFMARNGEGVDAARHAECENLRTACFAFYGVDDGPTGLFGNTRAGLIGHTAEALVSDPLAVTFWASAFAAILAAAAAIPPDALAAARDAAAAGRPCLDGRAGEQAAEFCRIFAVFAPQTYTEVCHLIRALHYAHGFATVAAVRVVEHFLAVVAAEWGGDVLNSQRAPPPPRPSAGPPPRSE